MPDAFVKKFSHLKNQKFPDRALTMLQRVASLVKPIMKNHGWVLPCLAEFFPGNPNLLDVNAGQKILLRLRPAHSPDTFLEEEDVVQTMLHELTHNVHGPHDDKFYKYLAGLQDEYDALIRSGYSGEGFFSKGQRLGVNVSHNLPLHQARAKAIEAAEKRKRVGQVLGGGGQRLGGGHLKGNLDLTPRELAAQAAERRAQDEKSCGQGNLAQQEAEKAAKDSIENNVVDLTLEDLDDDAVDSNVGRIQTEVVSSAAVPKPSKRSSSSGSDLSSVKKKPRSILLEKSNQVVQSTSVTIVNPHHNQGTSSGWTCPVCTLKNREMALQCDAMDMLDLCRDGNIKRLLVMYILWYHKGNELVLSLC
ncbi:WLM-domain-containingprotein [Moniliophthora roreri]|nr:WLM-domain-containingprotein [Moniliophthora roreri]